MVALTTQTRWFDFPEESPRASDYQLSTVILELCDPSQMLLYAEVDHVNGGTNFLSSLIRASSDPSVKFAAGPGGKM